MLVTVSALGHGNKPFAIAFLVIFCICHCKIYLVLLQNWVAQNMDHISVWIWSMNHLMGKA